MVLDYTQYSVKKIFGYDYEIVSHAHHSCFHQPHHLFTTDDFTSDLTSDLQEEGLMAVIKYSVHGQMLTCSLWLTYSSWKNMKIWDIIDNSCCYPKAFHIFTWENIHWSVPMRTNIEPNTVAVHFHPCSEKFQHMHNLFLFYRYTSDKHYVLYLSVLNLDMAVCTSMYQYVPVHVCFIMFDCIYDKSILYIDNLLTMLSINSLYW